MQCCQGCQRLAGESEEIIQVCWRFGGATRSTKRFMLLPLSPTKGPCYMIRLTPLWGMWYAKIWLYCGSTAQPRKHSLGHFMLGKNLRAQALTCHQFSWNFTSSLATVGIFWPHSWFSLQYMSNCGIPFVRPFSNAWVFCIVGPLESKPSWACRPSFAISPKKVLQPKPAVEFHWGSV